MTGALLALLLAGAGPQAARPVLGDLAYALGEAHGLDQACRGAQETEWRARMTAALDRESPAHEAKLQLVARFNAGFAAARAAHPRCDAGARTALSAALSRAAPMARTLADGR